LLDSTVSLDNLVLGVGLDADGHTDIVRGNMESLVHVAVGGSSGWGKSVFLQSLTYQLCQAKERPELVLIDLEGVTLAPFQNSDRLRYPIADGETSAVAILQDLGQELERRKALFSQYVGVDKLSKYNAVASERLAPIVTVIDEATALFDNADFENVLKTMALRARKYGLWLVLAGQDWKASTLDTKIRNQLSTRVQFKALNASQSRVLIGESDAKDLNAIGRAYAVLPGRQMLELQAPYISSEAIVNSVRGGGAAYAMPVVDVTSADNSAVDAERIRQLAAQGMSKNAIQREIFGYVGGAAYEAVTGVLG